jgi:hypothetical protein
VGRDTAFAVLALLRCRDRLEQVLDAVAEPRRSELARIIGESEDDETHLKHMLAEVIRREDTALRDAVAHALGATRASRVIQKWVARGSRR